MPQQASPLVAFPRSQALLEGVREFECSTNPYGQRFLRRFEGLGSFRRKSLFVDARKLTIFELSIPGQAQALLGNALSRSSASPASYVESTNPQQSSGQLQPQAGSLGPEDQERLFWGPPQKKPKWQPPHTRVWQPKWRGRSLVLLPVIAVPSSPLL
jgi:hypothetical protein